LPLPYTVLHEIAPRRARAVAQDVMGDHKPAVWVSDRYGRPAGDGRCPSGLPCPCAARRAVRHRQWRHSVRAGADQAAGLDDRHRQTTRRTEGQHPAAIPEQGGLSARPAAGHTPIPSGRTLQAQVKAWRTRYFAFIQDRRVSPTNKVAEREIRPSVVFRNVTGGFRSEWGPSIHAGYRSVTCTARIAGQPATTTAISPLRSSSPPPRPSETDHVSSYASSSGASWPRMMPLLPSSSTRRR